MNPLPADLAAAAALGGEMGRRFAEFDWAAHPLGPLTLIGGLADRVDTVRTSGGTRVTPHFDHAVATA